ncbi:MAG: membrane protein insertase YidC [Candidatus Omnitrophica bacterium]|nr:membrane protein insertase YidC [Candidatus Omnitrophota bacterium]
MERRLFLAIVLSILVLMLYSGIASHFSPPVPLQEKPSQEVPLNLPLQTEPVKEFVPQQKEIVLDDYSATLLPIEILQNEDLLLSITPTGTGIKECKLSYYDAILSQTDIGLLAEWQGVQFEQYKITSGISMSYDDKERGFEIKKTYRFTEDRYIVEMEIEFISTSSTKSYVQYGLNVGSMSQEIIKKNPIDQRYLECSVSLPSKVVRGNFLRFNPKNVDDSIQWMGIRDRYFCVIVRPLQKVGSLAKSKNEMATSYLLQVPQFELSPGERVKHSYLMYIGPQKPELIEKLGVGAEKIINFGFFDSISHILLGTLKILYRVSKNWGVSIILFSLLVFLAMSPLSIKSFKSMKRMQELQPIIEELKAKYKDSPQKMHKEVMELYREKKINPLGGCLPMFLQMPIFIALYQTLMRFIDLKGASFLWIKDLSEPDRLFVFSKNLPVVGNEFNLLPVIMIVTMLLQQKLTSAKQPQAESAAQQQKMMSLFMAVFFGIIFYHMPAGLVLYWTVNSLSMLIFQIKIIGRPVVKSEQT